jgi:hypothetical protein
MLNPTRSDVAILTDETPLLMVLIDTEEEFDWSRPLARENVGTTTIAAQQRAHRVFERYGIRPIYTIDYPVADAGFAPLKELYQDGLCDIGTHLHPWVNPPHDEPVTNANSYPGNLAPELERAKLLRLTDLIEQRFGFRPTVYKAGRYGVGPATAQTLEECGYEIDASVVPESDFRPDEGPDFRACGARPYWFGRTRRLLEIPVTVGFVGGLAGAGHHLYQHLRSPLGMGCHLPGIFSRLRLFERIRLSPEGQSFEELRRLTDAMHSAGHRVFSFTYHSPSLEPGHTPYVRNSGDLERFLACFDRYFDYFMHEIGGQPATPWDIKARLRAPGDTDAKLAA